MRKVTFIRWIGLSLLLVMAAIVFCTAGSGTVFAQPPEPRTATITGTVLYNGRPVVEQTNAAANFWARNEDTNELFPLDVTYDSTTGTYVISNVPPGRYLIAVEFDSAPPFDGQLGFSGDFSGSKTVVVSAAQNIILRHNLSVSKIIHLTSPVDNQKEIGHTSDPEDTYALGQLHFFSSSCWHLHPVRSCKRAYAVVSTLGHLPLGPAYVYLPADRFDLDSRGTHCLRLPIVVWSCRPVGRILPAQGRLLVPPFPGDGLSGGVQGGGGSKPA